MQDAVGLNRILSVLSASGLGLASQVSEAAGAAISSVANFQAGGSQPAQNDLRHLARRCATLLGTNAALLAAPVRLLLDGLHPLGAREWVASTPVSAAPTAAATA